jgi:hypothetical protein
MLDLEQTSGLSLSTLVENTCAIIILKDLEKFLLSLVVLRLQLALVKHT